MRIKLALRLIYESTKRGGVVQQAHRVIWDLTDSIDGLDVLIKGDDNAERVQVLRDRKALAEEARSKIRELHDGILTENL